MIELHSWNTPNGQKIAILLEELGATYKIVPVDISAGEQFQSAFSALSPNQKIPALVTAEGVTLFESGAIAVYMADLHQRLIAPSGQIRAQQLAWTFWQVGALGPMIGQWGHFSARIDAEAYAESRFYDEVSRLLNVLELQLASNEFLAGEEFSIADLMTWPWLRGGLAFLDKLPAERRHEIPASREWMIRVGNRPGVRTGLERLSEAVAKHSIEKV